MITVALDVMGADAGVGPITQGAAQLSREDVPIRILLVGDEQQITTALDAEPHEPKRLRIVHAPSFVSMTDKPAQALDDKPHCSVLAAARLVARDEAQALVSAGNTGAVILAASRTFERCRGVRRVALAAVYPTAERHGPHQDPFALMLDVGATVSCSADDLVAFAVMGSAYSRTISDIERPRVALLSNGSEPTKGTPAIVEAHERLRQLEAVEFIGNAEGLDIPRGTADVIVCEGFVGNIVLKMLEGVSEVAKDMARAAYGSKLRYKLGLGMLSKGIRKVRDMTDWKQYGGAPIVGFDRLVIKAHGRSNARAVRNALKVAAKTVERDLTREIRVGMAGPGA
ncbi:MAG: phosphate acyltransferase PlsX [Deltaproteobacteria bacterium]|nr:MAG: phosphate acyltransferase PlsX [Deltaproteobacteria bacterium]